MKNPVIRALVFSNAVSGESPNIKRLGRIASCLSCVRVEYLLLLRKKSTFLHNALTIAKVFGTGGLFIEGNITYHHEDVQVMLINNCEDTSICTVYIKVHAIYDRFVSTSVGEHWMQQSKGFDFIYTVHLR